MGLGDERELIARLTAGLDPEANRAGFASDCAHVALGDRELVATVDSFADPTHFPDGLSPDRAGRLAARATLSDLAAAGAEPLGLLAAYGIPPEADRETVERMADAIAATIDDAGGEVLGGDTKPSGELTATLTALGQAPPGEAMTRQGAEAGQLLLATGPLGGAGAALDRIREGLPPDEADPLVPPDRLPAGRRLREHGVRCAMDLSDGLAEAAHAIGQASGVRVAIEAEAIPLHPWAEDERGLEHALATGGDYELVAAIDADEREAVVDLLEGMGLSPAIVGRIEEGSRAQLVTGEGRHELDRGYEHSFTPE